MSLADAVEFYDRITAVRIAQGGAMLCRVLHDVSSEFLPERLIGTEGTPTETREPEGLDDLIGLHESIEIDYVVDGYEASLTAHDGATTVRISKGGTVMEALTLLIATPTGTERDDG